MPIVISSWQRAEETQEPTRELSPLSGLRQLSHSRPPHPPFKIALHPRSPEEEEEEDGGVGRLTLVVEGKETECKGDSSFP